MGANSRLQSIKNTDSLNLKLDNGRRKWLWKDIQIAEIHCHSISVNDDQNSIAPDLTRTLSKTDSRSDIHKPPGKSIWFHAKILPYINPDHGLSLSPIHFCISSLFEFYCYWMKLQFNSIQFNLISLKSYRGKHELFTFWKRR